MKRFLFVAVNKTSATVMCRMAERALHSGFDPLILCNKAYSIDPDLVPVQIVEHTRLSLLERVLSKIIVYWESMLGRADFCESKSKAYWLAVFKKKEK